jgi:hypothetical protein
MGLEEYLDLMLITSNIVVDAGMLPIVLHQNNLRPMYEKWPHGERVRWWTHAERFNVLDQPEEFRQYYVIDMLASEVVINSTSKGSGQIMARSPKMDKANRGVGTSPPRRSL